MIITEDLFYNESHQDTSCDSMYWLVENSPERLPGEINDGILKKKQRGISQTL